MGRSIFTRSASSSAKAKLLQLKAEKARVSAQLAAEKAWTGLGRVPLLNRLQKNGYPYSNLSTGGPRERNKPVDLFRRIAQTPGGLLSGVLVLGSLQNQATKGALFSHNNSTGGVRWAAGDL